MNVRAEGRDTAPARSTSPSRTQGSWVRDGGVAVEAAFADALGIEVGDSLTLNGRTFPVVDIAVTAALPPYSESCLGFCGASSGDAALVWLTRADVRSLASDARSLSYVSYLRLADLAAGPVVRRRAQSGRQRSPGHAPIRHATPGHAVLAEHQ